MGDVDRRKHDVDIIERVLGSIRDSSGDHDRTRVVNVDVPRNSSSTRSTLELTVGLDDSESSSRHR